MAKKEGHLWEKPATPHALDDEFEDTVLDPAWNINGVVNYVAIDPYTDADVNTRVQIHTDHRRSWLMMQGTGNRLTKDYTLPTNCLMWARVRFDSRSTKGSSETYCGLDICATVGGAQSVTNYMRLMVADTGTGRNVAFRKVQSGSSTVVASTDTGLSTRVTCIEYLLLHKLGSTYHAWCMGQSGEKIYVGSTTFAGDETIDQVGLVLGGIGAVPGSAVAGVDFFRVVESATYLP
jgi:hypothetical protein